MLSPVGDIQDALNCIHMGHDSISYTRVPDMKSVICRPLIVVGKGAAQAHADSLIRQLADKVQIPVLSTSMGRGVMPDDHLLSVIAARSLALATADVVLVLGAR